MYNEYTLQAVQNRERINGTLPGLFLTLRSGDEGHLPMCAFLSEQNLVQALLRTE